MSENMTNCAIRQQNLSEVGVSLFQNKNEMENFEPAGFAKLGMNHKKLNSGFNNRCV